MQADAHRLASALENIVTYSYSSTICGLTSPSCTVSIGNHETLEPGSLNLPKPSKRGKQDPLSELISVDFPAPQRPMTAQLSTRQESLGA